MVETRLVRSFLPATSGATAFVWNGAGYDSSQFVVIPGVLSGWQPEVNLPVGDGFFLDSPEATTVTFVGEVLQGEATNKSVPAGLSIQGSLFPYLEHLPSTASLLLLVTSFFSAERCRIQILTSMLSSLVFWKAGSLQILPSEWVMPSSLTKPKPEAGIAISPSTNLVNRKPNE